MKFNQLMFKSATRVFVFCVTIFATTNVLAVDCMGIPTVVKMGEYSAQEAYAIVRINSKDYRLGKPTDDNVKARMSLAQTALVADKNLMLRFYNVSSCDVASSERRTPNSVQLLKN